MKFEKKDRPISREVAEQQFQMWLDAYDIDAQYAQESNPDEFKKLENIYNVMISKIERGLITIEDDGDGGVCVVQKLVKPIGEKQSITYKHLTTKHLIARDRFEENELRKAALLSAMSGENSSIFKDWKWGADAKAADMVYSFFLLDF